MSELIPLIKSNIGNDSVQTVNARELHVFLEVGRDFSNWIKERIEHYGFQENQDFVIINNSGENSKIGRPCKDYHLSLDMAKELSMVERNEKGRQARRYFIECEKQLIIGTTHTSKIDELARAQALGLISARDARLSTLKYFGLTSSDTRKPKKKPTPIPCSPSGASTLDIDDCYFPTSELASLVRGGEAEVIRGLIDFGLMTSTGQPIDAGLALSKRLRRGVYGWKAMSTLKVIGAWVPFKPRY